MEQIMHINFGSISDSGLVHEYNTDACIEFPILNGHVFIVCDGHNGQDGHGALASKLIAENIRKYFYNRTYKDMTNALTNAITYANIALYEQSQKEARYNGIASTLAIMICYNGQIYYAYAGDSRIYIFSDGLLKPLTRDHTKPSANNEKLEVSILLGKSKDIKFGICKKPLDANEKESFLICTDGLTDQLTEAEITSIIADDDKAPEHKCKELLALANEQGGTDCTSIHVVSFAPEVEPKKIKKPVNLKALSYIFIAALVLTFLTFGSYFILKWFANRPADAVKMEQQIVKENKKSKNTKTVEEVEPVEEKQPVKNTPKEPKKQVESKKAVEPKKTTAPVKQNSTTSDKTFHNHEVKYGENLYRIAIKYNTTQQKLIDINGDKAKSLVAGSLLKIPVLAIHKVKSGETYSAISDKYNVKISIICQATGIPETTPLKEGMVLIIPYNK